MSILISVRDAMLNQGERYEFELNHQFDPIDYMGPVSFSEAHVSGYYIAGSSSVRFYGNVNITCTFACDRCLKDFSKDFSFDFSEVYSYNAEDEMFKINQNATIDFQPLLNDTVIANLPITRLCREDCKGLCPKCGIDKNFSSCSCVDEQPDDDNPFAVLRGLVD